MRPGPRSSRSTAAEHATTAAAGGVVPDTVEELTKLPGVGRKTANLVCGDAYGKPAVVTDTHFIRICNRLGFVDSTNPFIVEKEMRKLLDPVKSNNFCHRTVLFGRMAIGALALDPDLQPGEWRELTEEEVKLLEQPGEEKLFQTEQFVCETGILYAAGKETEQAD